MHLRPSYCLILTLFAVIMPSSLNARVLPQERVYTATDRDVYICGEEIRCSLFCVNATTGLLSDASAVAYLELSDANGTVARAKAAMNGGRGAAALSVPTRLATGNYTLVAYTMSGSKASMSGRTISIFNMETAARMPGGVKVMQEAEYAALPLPVRKLTDGISIATEDTGDGARVLRIANHRNGTYMLSLSVHRRDGIVAPQNDGIVDFLDGLHDGEPSLAPELEGEVIHGHTDSGSDMAMLSSIGDISNIYIAPVSEDGCFEFSTSNIFGSKDLVIRTGSAGTTVIEENFVGAHGYEVPTLPICATLENSLLWRKTYSKSGTRYSVGNENGSPFGTPDRIFMLDDYSRFPSVAETILEFVTDVYVRGSVISVRSNGSLSPDKSLVMLDGVPYSDHERILSVNPQLLKSIEVYNHDIIIGGMLFKGAVNFTSFKGRLPKDRLQDDMTRIQFNGTCTPFAESNPDGFTLFWHPLLELQAGSEIQIKIPSCSGPCIIIAEGMDSSGHPVCDITSY